jgi:hypothetical protein
MQMRIQIHREIIAPSLQANLGLRRAKQCEDFLALASWLAMKEPTLTTHVMKSQLSRLYGQLYAYQVYMLCNVLHCRNTSANSIL